MILITPGDPAGVGPEVAAKALAAGATDQPVTVIGSEAVRPWLERYRVDVPLVVPDASREAVEVASIREAVRRCLAGEARAMVTGPIHKARLAAQGFGFPGHTDFLGELCGVERPVMAFVGGSVRVALVTVHLPLREVADALTVPRIVATVRTAHEALVAQLGLASPRLLVCGLNPHAGDEGLLGREELDVVEPAVAACRAEGLDAVGPVSAETAFRQALHGQGDMVVAMYHDQGLAPLKALEAVSEGGSVNWTLGLPIVRTSVDHGTADDIAGKGIADERSMVAAIELAARLGRP